MAAPEGGRPAQTLARLLQHPVRAQALLKYVEADTSPSAVATALGARLNVVSHHTQVLLDAGAIELVRTRRRRGATEHFYRATVAGEIEDVDWGRLSLKVRRVLARILIDGAAREARDALATGRMDADSTHLSRNYLMLDAEGERELASLLRETFEKAHATGVASRDRAGTDVRRYEVVIMSFELTPTSSEPGASVRHPPARNGD